MLLESFIEWWNNVNPYVSFFVSAIGLVGFILSFVFFFKSKTKKEVSYASRTTRVVSENSNYNKLQFFYGGKQIKNLAATKIAIWNSGDHTIDKTEYIEKAPILISLAPPNEIYDVEIVATSSLSNNTQLQQVDANTYRLEFDFLDIEEGVIIKLLHSQTPRSPIEINGRLKSVKSFKRVTSFKNDVVIKREYGWLKKIFYKNMIWIAWIMLFALAVVTYFQPAIATFDLLLVLVIIQYYRSKKFPSSLLEYYFESQ